jgi:hypothetical protein
MFDVHESVDRDIIVKVANKMLPYRLIYYSKLALHVLGDVFAHYQEHLTILTVSGSVHPSCFWHQLAATWVNNTRYCKYSQVLLMMGENIARNM